MFTRVFAFSAFKFRPNVLSRPLVPRRAYLSAHRQSKPVLPRMARSGLRVRAGAGFPASPMYYTPLRAKMQPFVQEEGRKPAFPEAEGRFRDKKPETCTRGGLRPENRNAHPGRTAPGKPERSPGEGCARKTGTLTRGGLRPENRNAFAGRRPDAEFRRKSVGGRKPFPFLPEEFSAALPERCGEGEKAARPREGEVERRSGERGEGGEGARGRRAARKRARLLYKTARLRYNKEKARGSAAEKIQRVRGRRAPRR